MPYLVAGLLATSLLLTAQITQSEKDRSMSYLHATRKMFLDTIAGLSPAQYRYKPAPDRWSAAEIAEHLIVTEGLVHQWIQKALAQPPAPEKKAEALMKDEWIAKAVPNRMRRVQAPEPAQPTGRYPEKSEATAAFKKVRDESIAFVESSQADLRSHFAPHPFLGLLDTYQWTSFLAAHTERHLEQMREVIASPGFPAR
jgi:hypothetical protein